MKKFKMVEDFVMSDKQVIIWSKSKILYGKLQDNKGRPDKEDIKLEKSKFEIHRSQSKKDMRAS